MTLSFSVTYFIMSIACNFWIMCNVFGHSLYWSVFFRVKLYNIRLNSPLHVSSSSYSVKLPSHNLVNGSWFTGSDFQKTMCNLLFWHPVELLYALYANSKCTNVYIFAHAQVWKPDPSKWVKWVSLSWPHYQKSAAVEQRADFCLFSVQTAKSDW